MSITHVLELTDEELTVLFVLVSWFEINKPGPVALSDDQKQVDSAIKSALTKLANLREQ